MTQVRNLPSADFWRGKRVLLTGHTGFKGSWAALWLERLGAEVYGLGLAPETTPNLFSLANIARLTHDGVGIDLGDADAVRRRVTDVRPELVIHMAAQALVRRSYRDPIETVRANVLGTTHLLDAVARIDGVACVLVVTSDKVYANDETGRAFQETDRLGGHDPYSASKAATELITSSLAHALLEPKGVRVATVRGGNVIGGGDFSEDRIVPDIVRAAAARRELVLRYPDAVRPWQHVLDCLTGYFCYVEALCDDAHTPRALNIGPLHHNHLTVREIADTLLGRLSPDGAHWTLDKGPRAKEMQHLSLDAHLARSVLGYRDRLPGRVALDWTADWYLRFTERDDMGPFSVQQIKTYETL